MKLLVRILQVFVSLALASATGLVAAGQRVVLDPATCNLSFVLDATMHQVHGTLHLARGEFVFDGGTGAVAGEIVLDVLATTTGNGRRDRKMHDQVLLSELWPEIVFRPLRFTGAVPVRGRAELSLTGIFSLLGKTHEVTMPVTVEIETGRIRAEVEFAVPYVEWGLNDPSVFVLRVAKVVQVSVVLAGRLEEK